MHVITMVYGREPLDRWTAGTVANTVFIVDKAVNHDGNDMESGVGFPASYVFEFEQALYDSLRSAWAEGDVGRLEALWSKAKPIRISEAA